MNMDYLLSWYQRKVGAYDLQIWERAVEIREQQDGGMKSMDKRTSSVKPDLIDIDLVRGSTFSKNKPQYSWFVVSCQAFIRVLLLPIFVKWWMQQSSKPITLLFICFYVLQGLVLFLYINGAEEQFKFISPSEVTMPPIIMLVLGSVHCHVVSTNFRLNVRSDSRRLKKKRTLSSALLEPVVSSSHQSTLSLITSSFGKQSDATENWDITSDMLVSDATEPIGTNNPDLNGGQEKSGESLVKTDTLTPKILLENCGEKSDIQLTATYIKRVSTTSNSCSNSDNEVLEQLMPPNKDSTETDSTGDSKKNKKRRRRDVLLDELHSTSSGSNSSVSGGSDSDTTSSNEAETVGEDHVTRTRAKHLSATALLPCASPGVDRISVKIWESNQCKKVQMSLLDIGCIIRRKVQHSFAPSDMVIIGAFFSLLIASIPTLYRIAYHQGTVISQSEPSICFNNFQSVLNGVFQATHGNNTSLSAVFVIHAVAIERFIFSFTFFIMLSAAHKTFRQRFLFAKYFSHLTSSRRAKKSDVPHFRLDKVQNVRLWLSLRSYLRRRGPQRSVDVIVSSAFFLSLFLLCFISIQLLHDTDLYLSSLLFWEMTVWLLALAVFLLNFMTIGAQINRKYSNTSILLTEQINLYLQMKQKPGKKEELQRANCVLSIAAKLIKEIEMPFNIYGLAMNPLLYNITRVVVLSAFSGVVSEILGFKLKIWKIKS